MKHVALSAALWKDPQTAHAALAAGLDFPAYYGHNLDALYDCLTDLPQTQLIIQDCDRAAEQMPNKWPGFLAVFQDATNANASLKIILLPGKQGPGEAAPSAKENKDTAYLSTLLARFQVRRSRAQKEAFGRYIQETAQALGYSYRAETHKGMLTSRNLIVGDPEKAKVLFTAHYDTCAEMPVPNLIFPRSMALTLLIQLPLIVLMVALGLRAGNLAYRWTENLLYFRIVFLVVYFGLFALIFLGPSNRHTANDNTSGVAALLGIMAALPQEQRQAVAFLFFDNEEYGKVGSKQYQKAHPGLTENKLLLNLDCIGDGDNFLIVAPKKAEEWRVQALQSAFRDEGVKRAVHCSAQDTHYNSDQMSFPQGAAVAACRKNKLGYFVPRIHTRRDIICEQENLAYVTRSALRLMEGLLPKSNNKKQGGTKA